MADLPATHVVSLLCSQLALRRLLQFKKMDANQLLAIYHDFGPGMVDAFHVKYPEQAQPIAPGAIYRTVHIPSKTEYTIKFHLPEQFGVFDEPWWTFLCDWYNANGLYSNIMQRNIAKADLKIDDIAKFSPAITSLLKT